MATRPTWTTRNEIDFINSLGTRAYSHTNLNVIGKSQLQLLRSYLRTLKIRAVWAGMDRERIMDYVEDKIQKLESIDVLNSMGESASKKMKTMAGVV